MTALYATFDGHVQSSDLEGPSDWSERFDEYLYGNDEVAYRDRRHGG